MFCTSCGTQAAEGGAFCTGCGKPAAGSAAAPAQQSDATMRMPNAPVGVATEGVPEGVKGWSWGAFLLNWVWAVGNRTWIGLLAMVPYIGFLVAIWLGVKGREMAWKNREWESVEHFNRVQKKWSRWAVGLTVGAILTGIVAAIAIPAYQDYVRRVQEAKLEPATIEAPAPEPITAEAPATTAGPSEIVDAGVIDSNSDALPATVVTVAGTLARATTADSNRFVTLNGNQMFSGEDANWQFPVQSFKFSDGREAVLMASSGGRGNSCETMFFFLLADAKGMRPTPEFGTCSAHGNYMQQGDVVTLVLPKMGGNSTFVLANGAVSEDAQAVAMNDANDPSK